MKFRKGFVSNSSTSSFICSTNIKPKEAASRRDFTFNALAYDPIKEEVHDYFGGVNDIDNGIMRATSEQFAEDPLRVLRGMQFAARFAKSIN